MPPLTQANHDARAQNVTASEVGALLGVHPYTTPEAIFDRLTGFYVPEFKQSEAMALGSALEVPILRFAQERFGFVARVNHRTFVHPTVPLCATPDAFGHHPLWGRTIYEVKMSARHDQWRSLPEQYEWQVRAQLACTNRDYAEVIALVGMRLLRFPVYRDATQEALMLDAVDRFMVDHVRTGIRPVAIPQPLEEIAYTESRR